MLHLLFGRPPSAASGFHLCVVFSRFLAWLPERYLSCLGLHSGSVIDGLLDEKKMETRQKAGHFLTHCSFLNAKLSLGPRFSSNHFVAHSFI